MEIQATPDYEIRYLYHFSNVEGLATCRTKSISLSGLHHERSQEASCCCSTLLTSSVQLSFYHDVITEFFEHFLPLIPELEGCIGPVSAPVQSVHEWINGGCTLMATIITLWLFALPTATSTHCKSTIPGDKFVALL